MKAIDKKDVRLGTVVMVASSVLGVFFGVVICPEAWLKLANKTNTFSFSDTISLVKGLLSNKYYGPVGDLFTPQDFDPLSSWGWAKHDLHMLSVYLQGQSHPGSFFSAKQNELLRIFHKGIPLNSKVSLKEHPKSLYPSKVVDDSDLRTVGERELSEVLLRRKDTKPTIISVPTKEQLDSTPPEKVWDRKVDPIASCSDEGFQPGLEIPTVKIPQKVEEGIDELSMPMAL